MKSPKTLSQLRRVLAPVALVGLALLGSWSCDSANPLAPPGTVLIITASPSRIGLEGAATITVTGRRPDGNPLPDGTEIRFSTTLGVIQAIVETDDEGVARAILQADGRPGTATVSATVGGESEATIDVVIGEPPETQEQVTVSVNPNNIPVGEDSFATVTVVVRNADGTAAGAGISVVLTTNLGTLDPTQTSTDSSGIATSTLTAGIQDGTATITAFVGTADPATATLTIRDAAADISLQPDPPSITRTAQDIDLLAFVVNTQGLPLQGQAVEFTSPLGRFSGGNVAFTGTNGQATVTLAVTLGDLGTLPSFVVSARTASGSGQFIEAEATITIQ